jgi:hypothetical protein
MNIGMHALVPGKLEERMKASPEGFLKLDGSRLSWRELISKEIQFLRGLAINLERILENTRHEDERTQQEST